MELLVGIQGNSKVDVILKCTTKNNFYFVLDILIRLPSYKHNEIDMNFWDAVTCRNYALGGVLL